MTFRLQRAVACAAAVVFALAGSAAHAAEIALDESGSTLLYPLFQSWIAGYKSVAPDVALKASATGSGAGTDAAIAGSVRIGASDAYLSDAVAAHNPAPIRKRRPRRSA
jgi:phosphate transport system substrate-binding protein